MMVSACDFSFHMAFRFDAQVEADLREIVADGISSFKVFLAYKGALGLDDEGLYKTLGLAKELGVIVTAHCENADLIAQLQAKLLSEGKTGPKWHYHSRPPMVEAEGVHHLATFAALHGTHIYTVHTVAENLWKWLCKRGKGRQNMDRNAYPVSDSRQNGCGKTKFSGSQVCHVSTASGSF